MRSFPIRTCYTNFPPARSGTYPLSQAKRHNDGTYIGAVLPGPGVVVAETPRRQATGRRTSILRHSSPRKDRLEARGRQQTFGDHTTIMVPHLNGPGGIHQQTTRPSSSSIRLRIPLHWSSRQPRAGPARGRSGWWTPRASPWSGFELSSRPSTVESGPAAVATFPLSGSIPTDFSRSCSSTTPEG